MNLLKSLLPIDITFDVETYHTHDYIFSNMFTIFDIGYYIRVNTKTDKIELIEIKRLINSTDHISIEILDSELIEFLKLKLL